MSRKKIILAFFVFLTFTVVTIYSLNPSYGRDIVRDEFYIEHDIINKNSPSCLKMYESIIKYAELYDIPKKFAFGIAYAETRYNGPFDVKYKHTQKSFAGAIGPMQIMPATAKMVWKGKKISKKELMNNIDLNVHTSMKLLRILHDKYKDWKIVFGCYNTGRPLVNKYAMRVYNHKPSWINKQI